MAQPLVDEDMTDKALDEFFGPRNTPPIVFESPCIKLDTRLKIFDVEFYVSSVLLKIHSGLFRGVLGSRDRVKYKEGGIIPSQSSDSALASQSSSPKFTMPENRKVALGGTRSKYEWIIRTEILETGGHIVCHNLANKKQENETYFADSTLQSTAFHILLCAIYNRPYEILDAKSFFVVVKLTESFCALPILSRTLDGAMIASRGFKRDIREHAAQLYVVAAKLRNKLLFKECLIWVCGPHNHPKFRSVEDCQLKNLAKRAHDNISNNALAVSGELWNYVNCKGPSGATFGEFMCGKQIDPDDDGIVGLRRLTYPGLFRTILESCDIPVTRAMITTSRILANNLSLECLPNGIRKSI